MLTDRPSPDASSGWRRTEWAEQKGITMKKPQADHKFAAAVGAEIRRLRELNGWKIGQACAASGVKKTTWHQWERVGPKMCWLPLIAQTLETFPQDIIELADTNP